MLATLLGVIDIVADAIEFVIRVHVWALRHALGDRATPVERRSPLPPDMPSQD